MWQLIDGDPGGWIPSSVVSFIATQAIPKSMLKLNLLLRDKEVKKESEAIKGKVVAVRKEHPEKMKHKKESKIVVESKKEYSMVENIQWGMEKATPWMVVAILGITLIKILKK